MARARLGGDAAHRERTKAHRVLNGARKGKNTSQMSECRAVSPDKPLTDKQKAFVKALAMGESTPNALKRAGMSLSNPAYGSRLLAMPNIQRALTKEREAFAKASELSRKDVLNMFKEAYDMAKLMSESTAMTAAAREIGKMCGYYEPQKIDVTVTAGKKKVEQLSDEELFRLIEETSDEVGLLEHDHGQSDG